MAKLSLDDRLNQIEDKISDKSFRENKGLGNEVGYYIFDYDPREELYVRNHIAYLKDRINNGNKDFRIVEFDLFHLMIEILQEEGYLEAFFDLEKENGFFEMADSLVETLGLDETNELNLIISRILQEDLTDSVVFLTGVGKCHPIIASHNILNNLHQVLDSVPVVLFYPGEYSGQDLKLFGTMDSHNYYRAFRLVQIKNMFEKQIDRDIKGVIKVGQSDEENVYQELDEYVVTKELLKHFRDFFNNYEKGVDGYTDKMGVWISGFFGSGKSHFLKILSYLLKNSTVEGKRAIEYFTGRQSDASIRPKIEDPMLIAEMTKAGTIESDVMLFNIDSKGSAKVGSGKEAIVEVFMKVFNEMQGYCGSIPYLEEFERQLDNEGRGECRSTLG